MTEIQQIRKRDLRTQGRNKRIKGLANVILVQKVNEEMKQRK